ncbi:MAG TPA: alanine racemase [Nitrospiraceae bacterium]|nr:alanine racemase [Nitrospiraceae bacterium]
MSPSSPCPPTSARIELGNLVHNLIQTRRCVREGCDILAIVKANAYGHGSVAITKRLVQAGVRRFGVASVEEGAELREAGITHPVAVLGPLLPSEIPALVAHRLIPVIYDLRMARELAAQVPQAAAPYPIHVKIDTGMGRLGLEPEQLPALFELADLDRTLALDGLMTHLADADNPDRSYTDLQLERFHSALDKAATFGRKLPVVHMANSAGILMHPATHFSMVRPGIMLYGYHTLPHESSAMDLRPVLTWHSTIALIRSIPRGGCISYNRTFIAPRASRVAILPVGYGDGYSRRLSNRGHVLIHGRRLPIVGRVCMDMTMVDVTDAPEAEPGDEAVLIGRQGSVAVTASEIAGLLDTIPYEVLCSIGRRVPRLYSDSSAPSPQ